MITISQHKFIELLKQMPLTAAPATIITETVPNMRKTDNPFYGKVIKSMENNVFINFIYQNSVNTRRNKENKEADFEASPRRWGTRIPKTPLVEHNGQYYLETRFLHSVAPIYMINNTVVSKGDIDYFLVKPTKNILQDLDDEIIIRDFKISSIKEIKFIGNHYKII